MIPMQSEFERALEGSTNFDKKIAKLCQFNEQATKTSSCQSRQIPLLEKLYLDQFKMQIAKIFLRGIIKYFGTDQ